jgi:glutaredoxin
MKKNTILLAIIGLLLLLGISAFIAIQYHPDIFTARMAKKPAISAEEPVILFYGNGCPHCANVEKYLSENKIGEKISFAQKEVFNDKNNATLLGDKASSCGLSTDSIGVPFLWDKATGKCFVGDEEVINYFKTRIGQ